jgi:putative ABC transport system permease protein
VRRNLVVGALFLRPLVRRPWRFSITILGVAAGVASLVATLAASDAALYSVEQGVADIAGAVRLEIHNPGGVDESLLGRLVDISRDAVLCPVIEEVVYSPRLGDSVRVLGLDLTAEADVRPVNVTGLDRVARGGDLAPPSERANVSASAADRMKVLRGEGAYVSRALADKLGLAAGDSLALDVRARSIEIPVVGVFEASEGLAVWERIVVIDVARAQEIVGRIGRLDRIDLAPRRPDYSLEALATEVMPLLPRGYALLSPDDRRRSAHGLVRALEFNLNAISGISLFVAGVLVATTLATSVVQRRPTIALLSALGASRAQIVRAVVFEAATIGVAGGAAGVVLGFLGARATLGAMRGTMSTVIGNTPASAVRFDPRHALLGVACGLLVSACAVVLPLSEALRTPPIQVMKSERPAALTRRARRRALAFVLVMACLFVELIRLPAWNGLPVAALAGALCLMIALVALCAPALDWLGRAAPRLHVLGTGASTVRLALAALSAGRRRAAWAAGAVGIAVALAVSIAAMVHSFRTTLIEWSVGGLPADLTVRPLSTSLGLPLGRLDPALVHVVEDVFGRDSVDPFYRAPARVRGERVTLGGVATEIIGAHGGVPLRDGRDARSAFAEARAKGVLVNEAFAHRFDVNEGDRVEIEARGATLEREIAGVFYDYGDSQGLAVIDRADFLALYPDDGPREIAVFLGANSSVVDARARLLARLEGRYRVDVLSNAELKQRVMAAFDRTFAITRTLQAVAAIVAVIAVFSVLSALVLERRADIGLLGALGASTSQRAGFVLCQSLLLCLVGSAGGAACGILVGVVLVDVVNLQSFGWTLHYHQPWSSIAAVIGSVVAACIVAALIPAASAARASLHDALREED